MTCKQRGVTLIESLVALLVMGFGMLALAGIHTQLRHSGDHARQRGEASQLARSELERLRAFVALTRDGTQAVEALVLDEITADSWEVPSSNTQYTVARSVSPSVAGSRIVTVAVSWLDRKSADSSSPHRLEYQASLPAEDPRLVASLYTPPEHQLSLRRPLDRHPAIPLQARDLNASSSVFKPQPGGSIAWVFNRHSGLLTGVCTVSPASSAASLSLGDVASCLDNQGAGAYLLRGQLRFSLSSPPDPEHPNDPVQALGVTVLLSSSPHLGTPECLTDGSTQLAAGVQALDYYCRIPARQPSLSDAELYWSGSVKLTGLNLAPGGLRVCRYSADYDGNGQIDPAENPGHYQHLQISLAHQNFLIVRFEESCPAGQAVDLDQGIFTHTATAAHQP